MVHHTLPPEHLALIRSIAYRVVRRLPWHVANVDELVSAGYFGYRKACERYDATHGGRFEPFAEFHIRGAMLDELRRRDHLSRGFRGMKNQIEEARQALTARIGQPSTRAEIAAYLGMDEAAVETVDGMPNHAECLDDPLDPGGVLVGIMDDRPSPLDRCEVMEMVRRIEEAFSVLNDREVRILRERYVEDRSQQEVADRIGVSNSRVSQIEREVLAKLRVACSESLAA